MNEKFVAQLIAELQHAQTEALGLLTQAMCRQLDPRRLKNDLKGIMNAYEQLPKNNSLALRLLQGAVAAAQAEQMLQATPASEGPYPKRED